MKDSVRENEKYMNREGEREGYKGEMLREMWDRDRDWDRGEGVEQMAIETVRERARERERGIEREWERDTVR